MRLYAHRGASRDHPENTLEAFRGAVAQKADGVELDVLRCGSGELVVCHDELLTRLAGVGTRVGRTDYRVLRELDVGTRLGFAPARIPLLEEVLDALPSSMPVNVELKCDAWDDRGLSVLAGDLVVSRGEQERILFSSFNPLCLVRLAHAHPRLRRGLLLDDERRLERQLWWLPLAANVAVHPHHGYCTPGRVRAWKQAGLQVVVWTVDDPDRARALRDLGVDVLITNVPGAMRRGLRGQA